MIEIFDDLFCEEDLNKIENNFTSNYFPWYLSGNFTVEDFHYQNLKNKTPKEYLQFCHVFYDEDIHNKYCQYEKSPYFFPIQTILNKYPIKNLKRIKANFQPRCESFKSYEHNTPHIDCLTFHDVILYYVNESDGDTFIFDKKMNILKRIEHKRGRLVRFNGAYFHAGSHPSKNNSRITINFNTLTSYKQFLL